MMSSGSAQRAALAAAQARLLTSILDGTPAPPGFDPQRVALTGAGIANKRIRSAAHAWPALAAALGAGFAVEFRRFAAARTQTGGALEDGLAFADWLAVHGCLPERGAAERLGVRLRYRQHAGHLSRHKGFALRGTRIRPGVWLLAIRLPWGREWWRRWPG